MEHYYKTVQHAAEAEIIIKKSRFIGHVRRVEDDKEAAAFIEEIRAKHKTATHNCYAYIAGERDQFQKQSDDGEPSGTAGKPILEVIRRQGLKNTAVVVTRYYGGILLGAGGLVGAYTDGAVAGIAAGEPAYRIAHRLISVTVDYTWLGKLENELRNRGTVMEGIDYLDQVTLNCLPFDREAEDFTAWMTDLTQGQARIKAGERRMMFHDELPASWS